ncbi:C40 family peptidase [Nonomuraea sp. NPDC050022]|uniref:C40 family peptidase n=1 Tax=unclassified Nonomuraea TaxID=2593643 RepID=UPI0033E2EBD6
MDHSDGADLPGGADQQPIYVLIPLPPEACPAPNPPATIPGDPGDPGDTPPKPRPTKPGIKPGTKPRTKGDIAVAAAIDQLGTPFSWGGGTPSGPTTGVGRGAHTKGFDCSGLTLYAWSKAGIRLGHYTGTQFRQGRRVTLGELRKGDLVFFGGGTGDPTHVGLNLGGGVMIHAPKTGDVVRRTPFLTSTYYRPLYRGAVRPG